MGKWPDPGRTEEVCRPDSVQGGGGKSNMGSDRHSRPPSSPPGWCHSRAGAQGPCRLGPFTSLCLSVSAPLKWGHHQLLGLPLGLNGGKVLLTGYCDLRLGRDWKRTTDTSQTPVPVEAS